MAKAALHLRSQTAVGVSDSAPPTNPPALLEILVHMLQANLSLSNNTQFGKFLCVIVHDNTVLPQPRPVCDQSNPPT